MFLKEFFKKVNFEKKSADDNRGMEKYPACNELNTFWSVYIIWTSDFNGASLYLKVYIHDFEHFI